MKGPLVSVIVSCYNAEKYVRQAIDSILKQTYQTLELIVVNDGSTDKSENVIRSFSDRRLKYYYQDNRGQCAALNTGFQFSSGKYIKFYDADDILDAEVIEGQVKALENSNENCISFIEWRRFYNDVFPLSIDLNDPHTIHRDCTPIEYYTWQGKPPMVQCGLWLIPRKLLLSTGLWDERLSLINDTEFFTRVFKKTKHLKFSNTGYTFYRTNASVTSLSKDISRKGIKSAILSIDLSSKWMLQIENSERVQRIIVQGYVMVLQWAFPNHPMYVKLIERKLKKFPKEYVSFEKVGKIYNVVLKLFGWKVANSLSKYYHKTRFHIAN